MVAILHRDLQCYWSVRLEHLTSRVKSRDGVMLEHLTSRVKSREGILL